MERKKQRPFQIKMLFRVSLGVVFFTSFLVVVSFAKGEDKPSLAEQTLTKKRYERQIEVFPSSDPENTPDVVVEFSDFRC